jgi:uncharacterized protein (UPF0128 family)
LANLECYVQTEVNRLTDWIAVGTVALRVNQIIEVIPCNQVVGIHIETALTHAYILNPVLRQCITQLNILQTDESTVLKEEGILALIMITV